MDTTEHASSSSGEPAAPSEKRSQRYRQAFWDEPLLSEIGRKGRVGFIVPEDAKIKEWARSREAQGTGATSSSSSSPPRPLLSPSLRRSSDAPLPELAELQVLRHFNRLSQMNFSVETGMYPLGSCTM